MWAIEGYRVFAAEAKRELTHQGPREKHKGAPERHTRGKTHGGRASQSKSSSAFVCVPPSRPTVKTGTRTVAVGAERAVLSALMWGRAGYKHQAPSS